MNIITSIESDYERLERLYYSNVDINIGRDFTESDYELVLRELVLRQLGGDISVVDDATLQRLMIDLFNE
jgi:hypothetical protein